MDYLEFESREEESDRTSVCVCVWVREREREREGEREREREVGGERRKYEKWHKHINAPLCTGILSQTLYCG